MTPRVPRPRLLPLTIGMMAVVLLTKSFALVRAVLTDGQTSALIASARAGGHGTPPAKPPEKHGEKPAEKPTGHGVKPEAGHGAKPPEKPAEPPEPAPPPVPESPPPVSESEKAVLLELRERHRELEAREATLSSREAMTAAAEKKLSSRVEELQGLQKKLEGLDAGRRQQEENTWKGLVKVYETMKPRDAAVIFNDLAMPVLIGVLDRMKEARAAAILAAMTPEKAREVTAQLALTRARSAAGGESSSSPPSPASAGGTKAPGTGG